MRRLFRRPQYVVLALALVLAGCPLPYEYSGEGAEDTARDPASPDVTAQVEISYSETGGGSGILADGGSYTATDDTVVTLSTPTPNAAIYYAFDNAFTSVASATQIGSSSGSFTISRGSSVESRVIYAIAVGPNMRPSPMTNATVTVSPFPVITVGATAASISEDPTVIPGSSAAFTLSISEAPLADLTLSLTTDGDYDPTTVQIQDDVGNPVGGPGGPPFNVTWIAGSTTPISLPIAATAEDVDTTNESATLILNSGVDYAVANPSGATITIADTNTPTLKLTNDAGSPAENADNSGSVTYTIEPVGGTLSSPATFLLETNGTYESSDILESPATIPTTGGQFSVTLPANQANVTVVVTPQPDTGDPDYTNETFGLRLVENQPTYSVDPGSELSQEFQIIDSSALPTFSVTSANASGLDDGTFTVTLGATPAPEIAMDVPLQFITAGGGLIASFEQGDFSIDGDATFQHSQSPLKAYTFQFPANQTSASFDLIGLPDSDDLNDEDVVMEIAAGLTWNLPTDVNDRQMTIVLQDPDRTVTYDPNDTGGSDATNVPTDNGFYRPNVGQFTVSYAGSLARPGFVFTGWNDQADGTGTNYIVGNQYTIGSTDLTLYAQWALLAPSLSINVADQVTFSSQTRVNPLPTFDLSSDGLTSADTLTFRLKIGSVPSTGLTKAADEEEVVVASGNAEAYTWPSALALNTGVTVYAIQRGTSTDWSTAASVSFTVDNYSWANRSVPTSTNNMVDLITDSADRFVDLRGLPWGNSATLAGNAIFVPAGRNKTIVGDGLFTIAASTTNRSRVFELQGGGTTNFSLEGLVIRDGRAEGEAGENSTGAGGGGGGAAGIGGAIYAGSGVVLSLTNTQFEFNEAQGGVGGDSGGSGEADGGAGGGPSGGAGGLSGANNGMGNNADNGANATDVGTGDFSGGGGGGAVVGVGGAGSGGDGGYGGGGGGGGNPTGSSGGVGLGGSGGGTYGSGTYGGDGANGTVGDTQSGGGGGGAGLGGAIFMDAGSTINIYTGVIFRNNTATGGDGGNPTVPIFAGESGEGRGGALFIRSGTTWNPFAAPGYDSNSASTANNDIAFGS